MKYSIIKLTKIKEIHNIIRPHPSFSNHVFSCYLVNLFMFFHLYFFLESVHSDKKFIYVSLLYLLLISSICWFLIIISFKVWLKALNLFSEVSVVSHILFYRHPYDDFALQAALTWRTWVSSIFMQNNYDK